MPTVCGICDKPIGEGDWGFFTPDKGEWDLLTEEQKSIFAVVTDVMVHFKCYRGLASKVKEDE